MTRRGYGASPDPSLAFRAEHAPLNEPIIWRSDLGFRRNS